MRNTSIVTTVATAALTGMAGVCAWRLGQRSTRRALGVDPSGACGFAPGSASGEPTVFAPLDGTRSGPAVAALREMYVADDGSLDVVLDSFADDQVVASIAEVTGILAVQANNGDATDQHVDEDSGTIHVVYDLGLAILLGGRGLLLLAKDYEADHSAHLMQCSRCRRTGLTVHLARAQWCRDLADELVTNPDLTPFLFHDIDVADAVHVLRDVFEHYCDATDSEPEEAIEALAHGLAMMTAHSTAGDGS